MIDQPISSYTPCLGSYFRLRIPGCTTRRRPTHWWGSNVTLRDSPSPPSARCTFCTRRVYFAHLHSQAAPSATESTIAPRKEQRDIAVYVRTTTADRWQFDSRSKLIRPWIPWNAASINKRARVTLHSKWSVHVCTFILFAKKPPILSDDRSLMRRDKRHTSNACRRNKCSSSCYRRLPTVCLYLFSSMYYLNIIQQIYARVMSSFCFKLKIKILYGCIMTLNWIWYNHTWYKIFLVKCYT